MDQPEHSSKSRDAASGPSASDSSAGLTEIGKLARALRRSPSLDKVRALLRDHMKYLWSAQEVFFVVFDPVQSRFLMLLEDGSMVPKLARTFALDRFLTSPDQSHTYHEQLLDDSQILGSLARHGTAVGGTIHSLAVPIHRDGLLRGALGILADRVFEWTEEDVNRLAELGHLFLDAYQELQSRATPVRFEASGLSPQEGAEQDLQLQLRERLSLHEAIAHLQSRLLEPAEVVGAATGELAPFFPNFHFSIAVYYPESRLFVVHSHGDEPARVSCDEMVEGYFLYRTDEDILAIENYQIWPGLPPLALAPRPGKETFKSGLFAAVRVHGNLIAVAALQSMTPFAWEEREIELVRAAIRGFGLAYYNAMIQDNLTYSCREAHRQLEEARSEGRTWQRSAEQFETALSVARAISSCPGLHELVIGLIGRLEQKWPGCRVTVQHYLKEKNAFAFYPAAADKPEPERPARFCLQTLFLNNVPVNHIVCDSPEEISYYRDVDPQLVSECEQNGFRAFCTAPIFFDDLLWGTITVQAPNPGACSLQADLLAEIGRAVAVPIRAIEFRQPADAPDQGPSRRDSPPPRRPNGTEPGVSSP